MTLFTCISYDVLHIHSFLKEFEKHFSFEQMISSMKEKHGSVYAFLVLKINYECYHSDETNFAYIIEAVQIKEPPSMVEPSNSTISGADVHRDTPPPKAACAAVNNSCGEAVQSVKELFPHLEISYIEV